MANPNNNSTNSTSTNPKLKIGFLGSGEFSAFQQSLIKKRLSDKISVEKVYNTTNKYNPESSDVDALYVVIPDILHKKFLDDALNKGSHKQILVEKPAFLSENDYLMSLQASMENEVDVYINFQRRYDPMYEHARKIYQKKLQIAATEENSYDLIFESRDPAPHEEDQVYKYLHNSIIHDIDSAVWFNWPFSEATLGFVTYSKSPEHKVDLEILFTRRDGQKSSKATIQFSKGAESYLNRIDIIRQQYTTVTFMEDFEHDPFFERYEEAYVKVWEEFYGESLKTKEQKYIRVPAPLSIEHHSFSFTFRILEQALEKFKK